MEISKLIKSKKALRDQLNQEIEQLEKSEYAGGNLKEVLLNKKLLKGTRWSITTYFDRCVYSDDFDFNSLQIKLQGIANDELNFILGQFGFMFYSNVKLHSERDGRLEIIFNNRYPDEVIEITFLDFVKLYEIKIDFQVIDYRIEILDAELKDDKLKLKRIKELVGQ